MRNYIFFAVLASFACLLGAGCGVTATVTDFSQNRTEVSRVKLSPSRRKITIIHGGATRIIKLKSVEKISIYPHATKNRGGQLYYQAEVTLDDGTKLGFSEPSKGKPADAYVCIDGALRGRVEGGKFRITLDNVSTIEIQE